MTPDKETLREVSQSLRDVDEDGNKLYPTGSDRARLCRASVVLAAEVRLLADRLAAAEKVVEAARLLSQAFALNLSSAGESADKVDDALSEYDAAKSRAEAGG